MSYKVMDLVWKKFPASGSDLTGMLAMADWCDDTGGSLFPSIAAVAKKIRVSDSQARRIIRGFEKAGYIKVVGNAYGGAPGTTRQYRLNVSMLAALPDTEKTTGSSATPSADAPPAIDATPSSDARGDMDAQDGVHPCAGGGAPMRETGSTHASQTVSEPLVNHQIKTTTTKLRSAVPAAPIGVDDQVWCDFLSIRKAKRLPLTETAMAGIRREAESASIGLNSALLICCERGWACFKAQWVVDENRLQQQPRLTQTQSIQAANNRAVFGDALSPSKFVQTEKVISGEVVP